MYSVTDDWTLLQPGFPIRKSPDITPECGFPGLIAAYHVLHRLSVPRHPSCALSSLTTKKKFGKVVFLRASTYGKEIDALP